MANSKVCKTTRGQTVRLPKAVAFPDDVLSVDILRIGHSRVLVPKGMRWEDPFESGPRFSEDLVLESGASGASTEQTDTTQYFPETRPDDVYGSLSAKGKSKTIEEMDAGVLAEAARRHKRGS